MKSKRIENIEIRPLKSHDKTFRYEIVKWYPNQRFVHDNSNSTATSLRELCFTVALLYTINDGCIVLEQVGARFFKDLNQSEKELFTKLWKFGCKQLKKQRQRT